MTPEERALRQQAATPPGIFAEWHYKHNFTVDACAVAWNAKLKRFWSPEQDGLKQDWAGERVWCNPPYAEGEIQPWVEKALEFEADVCVMLLPVRTDMAWFHDIWAAYMRSTVWHYIRFTWHKGRLKFIPPPGITYSSPNERHMIVEFLKG